MIINQREHITWGEVKGTSMYGSKVTYHQDQHISLYNPLVSAGEILKTWLSIVNYQAHRTQPSLPLLKRKQDYQLCMNLDCTPKNSVYIRISFFDRYGDVIEEKIEKTKVFDFTYPEDAYTYQVSLLSAGFESLDFYYFSIKEMNSV